MKILGEENPLEVFCTASKILNDSVEHTLGPRGTNSAIVNKHGQYEIINDGKSIIEGITSLDPVISPALETLKQASFETNRKAGDGTTSTTIIMNALLQGAREYLSNSSTPINLAYMLNQVKDGMIKELDKCRLEINEDRYSKIAEVALGGTTYSEMIADVYKFLDKGQRPSLLKSDIPNIEVEKIDGVNITKSKIVSSLFVNTTEHRDVGTIFLYSQVNRFQEITQLLRLAQKENKEIFLFYNQLSTDILENILFNYTQGSIKLIPICLGGYGRDTYKIMEELSDYCDSNIIDDTHCKLSEVQKIKIGSIDYAVINAEQVILKSEKNNEKSYVHLQKNSVIMRIGGTNVIEREEVFKRIEDAINSLGNAIEYGIVPGAGITYKTLIDKVNESFYIPKFVIDAMYKINSIVSSQITIDDENTFDSAMVVKEVITNAFSIVSQVITTKVVIHENIR